MGIQRLERFERGRLRGERAMHERLIRIAALARPIEHVDLVALLQKQRGPAAAAVGRAEPVRALPEAAMNQHDRIGVANLGGDPVLDVHLHAVADGAASEQRVLDAVPVVGPLGDIEHGSRSLRIEPARRADGCQRSTASAPELAAGNHARRYLLK